LNLFIDDASWNQFCVPYNDVYKYKLNISQHSTLDAFPDLPSVAVRKALISLLVVQFARPPLSHIISTQGLWLSVMVPTSRHMIAGNHRLWFLTWCLNPVKFFFIISSPPHSLRILRHISLLKTKGNRLYIRNQSVPR
jgi:hypothetical protein